MKRVNVLNWYAIFFLLGVWRPDVWAAQQDVEAVLSSDSVAYREALVGFTEGYGRSVPSHTLSRDAMMIPPIAKIVVAIGGKAAAQVYAPHTTLIYCLTPGMWLQTSLHAGPTIRIHVAPRPQDLFSRLKAIQPALKRLGVIDTSSTPLRKSYYEEFVRIAKTQGIDVSIEYLDHVEELPEHLRILQGKVNALWLPPNPLLITPSVFTIVKEFSYSNDLPFYAPMDSLVEKGATASIASSFRDMGYAAGQAAAKALTDHSVVSTEIYPEQTRMVLNLSAAKEANLKIPPGVAKKADRIIP